MSGTVAPADGSGRQGCRSGSSMRIAAHRTRPGLGRLEAHRHHAAARAPHPAAAHGGVLDVHARRPGAGRRRRRPRSSGASRSRLVGRLDLVVDGLAEQVLLDPVGQPGDADAEQADAAGGVEVLEQGDGEPGDGGGGVGGGGERRGAVDGGEVVQPDLDRDRAARPARWPEPVGDAAGLPGEQRGHQPAVGQVGVVGALDADRLGLPLGRPPAGRRARGRGGAASGRGRCRAGGRSSSSLTASRSATVWMPARRSRSVVAGPTPGITETCIGRSRSISVPGGTTTRPSGLSRSLATLAMNFDVPTPDRRRQAAGHLGDLRAQPLGERGDGRRSRGRQPGRGQVDEGLVERQRLDQRRGVAQHRHHPSRWRPGRRGTGRSGRPRAGTATAPRGSTWPTGRRTSGLRTTPWRPRRARRRRRPRRACRAATACRAARPPRRTRRGRGAAPTRPDAWAQPSRGRPR